MEVFRKKETILHSPFFVLPYSLYFSIHALPRLTHLTLLILFFSIFFDSIRNPILPNHNPPNLPPRTTTLLSTTPLSLLPSPTTSPPPVAQLMSVGSSGPFLYIVIGGLYGPYRLYYFFLFPFLARSSYVLAPPSTTPRLFNISHLRIKKGPCHYLTQLWS